MVTKESVYNPSSALKTRATLINLYSKINKRYNFNFYTCILIKQTLKEFPNSFLEISSREYNCEK